MSLDSMIMEDIIKQSLEHGLAVLPVHDSIIVQRKHGELAKKIMKDVYEKRLNELIGIAVSPNSLGLGQFNPQEYKKRTKRYTASLNRWKTWKTMFHYPKSYLR